MSTLLCGIDDAGRGPIIGPMIICGVLIDKKQDWLFKKHNIRDSKLVSSSERIKLASLIKKNILFSKIIKVLPREIDNSIISGTNLNILEALKMAEIVNNLNSEKYKKHKIRIFVDCPSVNIFNWKNNFVSFIKKKENIEVVCEHKADLNYTVVSAASILAKVVREEEIDKIRREYKKYGDIGSGYPADPITREFLKKHGNELKNSGIFRKTWQTWKEFFPKEVKTGQKTLNDF